jgi:hypothetical protein
LVHFFFFLRFAYKRSKNGSSNSIGAVHKGDERTSEVWKRICRSSPIVTELALEWLSIEQKRKNIQYKMVAKKKIIMPTIQGQYPTIGTIFYRF